MWILGSQAQNGINLTVLSSFYIIRTYISHVHNIHIAVATGDSDSTLKGSLLNSAYNCDILTIINYNLYFANMIDKNHFKLF